VQRPELGDALRDRIVRLDSLEDLRRLGLQTGLEQGGAQRQLGISEALQTALGNARLQRLFPFDRP
jgi:hypothetical protein